MLIGCAGAHVGRAGHTVVPHQFSTCRHALMAGLLYFLLVIWPNKVRMRSIPYLQVNNPGEDTILYIRSMSNMAQRGWLNILGPC